MAYKIYPKEGVEHSSGLHLRFGMTEDEVIALIGQPDHLINGSMYRSRNIQCDYRSSKTRILTAVYIFIPETAVMPDGTQLVGVSFDEAKAHCDRVYGQGEGDMGCVYHDVGIGLWGENSGDDPCGLGLGVFYTDALMVFDQYSWPEKEAEIKAERAKRNDPERRKARDAELKAALYDIDFSAGLEKDSWFHEGMGQ